MTLKKKLLHVVAALAFAALYARNVPSRVAPDSPRVAPEVVVQKQLEAYNARDIDAFLAAYADDVELFEHPNELLAGGLAEMRRRYTARFSEPNLHAVITGRMVMGNIVIDHERVNRTFKQGPGTAEAIAIYEVRGEKIARVWLITGPQKLRLK